VLREKHGHKLAKTDLKLGIIIFIIITQNSFPLLGDTIVLFDTATMHNDLSDEIDGVLVRMKEIEIIMQMLNPKMLPIVKQSAIYQLRLSANFGTHRKMMQ
jgi:hypothetical protein